jgi:alpha-L-arabinofuranosidase
VKLHLRSQLPLLVLLLSFSSLQAADIRIDTHQPAKKVSPSLFGIFVEEINHGGDGGIYSELVRNGSFGEAQTLDGWYPVRTGQAKVNIFFDATLPISAAKPRSLRVEVTAPAGEKCGVANEGYWGIGVSKDQFYEFATWGRSTGFTGPLTVSLEGSGGQVYAQQEINGLTAGWKRLTASLKSNTTDPKAHLVISSKRNGTFWLNLVSLRPAGGEMFRADLLQKLKDLKPAFLRFPGGTYVQGNDRESAFRWKNTIGKLEDRAGHRNAPWVYWSSDNLGFHEYLLLCEKLAAVPMYVAYAGMTWTPTTRSPFGVLQQSRIPASDIPLDQMGPIVQDAVDAVEYANGPVSSKWGAVRAKAGHPAPFGLKYVEIGNEDGRNPLYAERYMMLYKAIKARFPDVQIISNTARVGNTALPMDFLDEHAYIRPQEAVETAKRYDAYDRTGPKVFLGEYAVQQSAGFGNMRAALAEAVLLSSLERNSDVLQLASYAPLLANVNAVNWKPDLIYFDSASSFGTPSYYVQKMFADTRIDSLLPVTVNAPQLPVPVTGDVSPVAFQSEAEFQDAKVTGSGNDYTYSLRARKTAGDGGFSIRFAARDGGPYLTWMLGVKRRGQLLVWGGGGLIDAPMASLETSFGGPIGPQVPRTIEKDVWYDVKIHVQGRKVACYLDGKQIHDVTVPETLGPSVYALSGRNAAGNIVVRLVNLSSAKEDVSFDLQGGDVMYRVTTDTLSSQDLDAENTLSAPTRIAPKQRQSSGVSGQFHWELEGNSFTILTLSPAGN